VRVLSATNADLNAEVAVGKFRQDLLFRLNTVELHLPPLRDRQEDIPPLAEHFLRQHRERYRRSIMGFTPEAFDALRAHSWPGNVRELDHVIERAVLMSSGQIVTAFDLALQTTPDARLSSRLEEMSLEDAERLLITKALARFEGNANRAAEALGETVAGRVQFFMAPMANAVTLVRDGRLVGLGVSSKGRDVLLPELPTIDEAGVPGYEQELWFGLLGPGGMPRAITTRLNAEIGRILADADTNARWAPIGIEPRPTAPQEFDRLVASEIALYTRIARAANITSQ